MPRNVEYRTFCFWYRHSQREERWSCEPNCRAGWSLWESLYQKQKALYSFYQ